jgi:hypothetical protein
MMMALMAAFRAQEVDDNEALAQGQDTGMERYRQGVERANRDKILVRDGDCYAVMWTWELAVLGGMRLRNYGSENVETILERYGVVIDDRIRPTPGGESP